MWTIKEITIVFIPPWEHNQRNEISSKQNKNIRRYVETRDFFIYRGRFEYQPLQISKALCGSETFNCVM